MHACQFDKLSVITCVGGGELGHRGLSHVDLGKIILTAYTYINPSLL